MVPHASSSPKQHKLFGKISEDWHPQQQKHKMKEKRDKLKVFYWAYLKFATSDRVPNISPVLRRHLGRLASQYFPAGRSALLLRGHPKPLSLRRDPVKGEFIRQEPRLSGAAHLSWVNKEAELFIYYPTRKKVTTELSSCQLVFTNSSHNCVKSIAAHWTTLSPGYPCSPAFPRDPVFP